VTWGRKVDVKTGLKVTFNICSFIIGLTVESLQHTHCQWVSMRSEETEGMRTEGERGER